MWCDSRMLLFNSFSSKLEKEIDSTGVDLDYFENVVAIRKW